MTIWKLIPCLSTSEVQCVCYLIDARFSPFEWSVYYSKNNIQRKWHWVGLACKQIGHWFSPRCVSPLKPPIHTLYTCTTLAFYFWLCGDDGGVCIRTSQQTPCRQQCHSGLFSWCSARSIEKKMFIIQRLNMTTGVEFQYECFLFFS